MATNKRPPQKQLRLPAPLGGLNTIQSVMATPPTDALVFDNFIVAPYGVEIRKGWRYWYDDEFLAEVRTIMSYQAVDPSNNRLFAATAEANGQIYNITATGATAPAVAVVTPAGVPDIPGEWHSTMYVTPGGAFLCAVSAGAGYWTYEAVAGWVQVALGGGAGQVAFPVADTSTMADLAFVMAWKNRLWFLHRNSSKAYYLPTNQITGQLVAFDFGGLLTRGGLTSYLANWTYDSGSGVDDSLVVVSNQGDMLIYQGTDPSSINTFGLKGVWFIGRVPAGRRGFCKMGGDVWMASEYGIIPISDHVSGRVTAPTSESTAAGKFNPTLSAAISSTLGSKYWQLIPYATEELLIVCSPYERASTGTRQSYIQSAATKSWATTTNFDPLCGAVHDGNFYFSDRSNRVCQGFIGYNDGDSFDSAVAGNEVTGRFLTGFYDYGSPNLNKTATRVRLLGMSDGNPAWHVKLHPEYQMNDLLSVGGPAAGGASLWDSALWDSDLWLSGGAETFKGWRGVAAFGKKLALQLVIRGSGATVVTDYEVTFKEGNGL